MAEKTPTVKDKTLTLWDHEANRLIMELDLTRVDDWDYWQSWLASEIVKSFRYIGPDGTSCTVIRERRKSFGREDVLVTVWYAHKRKGGELRRRYLGLSENLTYQRLKAAALELAQREPGDSLTT